jgi:hypothetical protein
VLEFKGASWRDLTPMSGHVTHFIVPRDLIGAE